MEEKDWKAKTYWWKEGDCIFREDPDRLHSKSNKMIFMKAFLHFKIMLCSLLSSFWLKGHGSCRNCFYIIYFKKGHQNSVQEHNPGQRVVNKFTKLRKIGFSMECFTADFLRVFNENMKIWLLGVRLGTCHQIQVLSCSATREAIRSLTSWWK